MTDLTGWTQTIYPTHHTNHIRLAISDDAQKFGQKCSQYPAHPLITNLGKALQFSNGNINLLILLLLNNDYLSPGNPVKSENSPVSERSLYSGSIFLSLYP